MRSILPVAVALIGIVTPAAALAGANKTWVSGTGVDSGACQFAAPCKSFQYALAQTSAGGEIDVRDSGGYGTVVITKAISIVAADGVLASISVPAGGVGITVSATDDDIVILRGLTIDGHSLGTNTGIAINSPAVISKSSLRNLQYGVVKTNTPTMTIDNNEITRNLIGILIKDQNSRTYLSNNRFNFNGFGISADESEVLSFGDNKFVGANTDVVGGQLESVSQK